ncbi:flagellar biosynthetic protein FliR [Erythrobacter sp. YT30]|uniref:flagellar biosynthetic protein FliR n=1 Tax=Erythrobacter sp. YT30 TaxID=1735012 RepID=UPI00076DAC27|nr:flagellar biosynthetic protein FliR [Erythrobacter sp. YT30]KWV91691.1 flagellar biosynthetic protein FliR [Erythrobacter sp. YT30]
MNTLEFGFGALDRQLWELLLLSVRCGVAILAAPMIGGLTVPVQARAFLGFAFGVFVAVWMPLPPLPDMMSFAAILAVLQEVIIGAAMGFVLQVAFAVPLIAAEQISGSMGLAIATSIDPSSGAQSGALGTYFGLVLTLLFFAIGGHLLWFELLIESYRILPVGSFAFGEVRARGIVDFMGYGFALAAAIGFPVVLVLMVTQLVTGMISRSAPALNLFALGLPAGVLAGIAALIIAMPILIEQFVRLLEVAVRQTELLILPGGAPV